MSGSQLELGDGSEMMPEVPPENQVECGTCQIKRPRSAMHCYACGVCVDQVNAANIVNIFRYKYMWI